MLATFAAIVLLLIAVGCGSSKQAEPSTTTTARSTSTSAAKASSTTAPTSSTTTTVGGDPNGPIVSAEGAQLAAAKPGRPLKRRQGRCDGLAPRGDQVQCGTGKGATADLVWVVDHRRKGGTSVQVLKSSGQRFTPVLGANDPDGSAWSTVDVEAADIGGPPGDELLVGFRSPTTNGLLQVDVVGGNGTVLFHRELEQGRAEATGGSYQDWSAQFGPNDPNCCPSVYRHAVIAFVNGNWREVQGADVPPSEAPKGQFA